MAKICNKCYTENPDNSMFCIECGISLSKEEKKGGCPHCGADIIPGSKFCAGCGKSVESKEKPQSKIKTKEEFKNSKTYSKVKSAVIFLFSFLLLITAFAPIISYEVELDEYNTVEMEYTPLEFVTFLVDSMYELDREEIKYDTLYEELEDLRIELQNSGYYDYGSAYLSYDAEEIYVDYTKTATRLAYRSEYVSASPQFIAAAVMALLYVAFCLTFFGISLYVFIKTMMGKNVCFGKAVSLLCLAPFVMIITYYILGGTNSNAYFENSEILFYLFVAVASLIAEAIVFAKDKINIKKAITTGLCVVFSIVVICLSFSTAFVAELRGRYIGSTIDRTAEVEINVEYFQGLEQNDISLEEYFSLSYNTDIQKALEQIIKSNTVGEVRDGDADMEVYQLVNLTMYRWMKEPMVLFSATYYMAMAAAILCALAAWRAIVNFCQGKKKTTSLFSIFAIVSTVLYVALILVFIISGNMMIEKIDLERVYTLSLSGTPVFALIFAILALVSRCIFKKEQLFTPALVVSEPQAEAEAEEAKEQTEEKIEEQAESDTVISDPVSEETVLEEA